MIKIIGVDPGYAIVGVGVVSYDNPRFATLNYGAITTPPEMPFPDRLREIYQDFTALLTQYKPDAVAIERLFFSNNQKTAIDVAQARGVILLASSLAHIPCYDYTPLQVKQAVVGYGKATKAQVIDMTTRFLTLAAPPHPDDVADALAVAICHAHSYQAPLKGKASR